MYYHTLFQWKHKDAHETHGIHRDWLLGFIHCRELQVANTCLRYGWVSTGDGIHPVNIERCGKAIMNVDHVPKNLSASLCYFGPGIANFKMLKRQNFPFFGEDWLPYSILNATLQQCFKVILVTYQPALGFIMTDEQSGCKQSKQRNYSMGVTKNHSARSHEPGVFSKLNQGFIVS